MPRIEVRDGEGTVTVFPLGVREIVVGRQPDCDIVLNKNVVSRRHARIYPAKSSWAVADLKSSHGTYVNGERIDERVLAEGDAIRIGEFELVFSSVTREHAPARPRLTSLPVSTKPTEFAEITAPRVQIPFVPAPAPAATDSDPEVLERRRLGDGDLMRQTLIARDLDLAGLAAAALPKPADKLGRDSGSEGGLLALIRISDGISRCTDVDTLCKVVTEMALKASGADRGVIALKNGKGDFVPRAQMAGKRNVNAGTVKISTTFVDRVLREKEAMIARDVGQDIDLSSARSIVALDIRSVVCVPLLDGEEVRGYLYLDRIGAAGGFSGRDLDLLLLIGYHAAAAIGRLEEQTRRHTMSRFFSADVIRHLDEEGSRVENVATSTRAQLVTVLFSDIQGFTAMSETMDPRTLKGFLDEYFDRMTEILVDRHGGTLDKYIGDGIMALFGAPYSKGPEIDARNAVAAALDMQASLADMRSNFPHYGNLQMRIGINSGKVVAGMMGSSRRFEYSVLGDAVNVASRLESTGEAGRIQIGDTTHVAVKNTFDCAFAGERKMKNRGEPVKCWWVLGRKKP